MRYFAYGSNMSTAYIREYCPSARFVMRAVLPNFHIEFRRYSTDLQGGISSIIEAPGEMVHGVLFAIEERELLELDVLEDVPQGIYRRDTYMVLGEDTGWQRADLYRVCHPEGPYTPSQKYLDFMVAGTQEHHLDKAYTNQLIELRATLE